MIFQKRKHHSSLLWKAFQISGNYFLLHRHFNPISKMFCNSSLQYTNSCYCRWVCGQILFFSERQANEAKGCPQKNTYKTRISCIIRLKLHSIRLLILSNTTTDLSSRLWGINPATSALILYPTDSHWGLLLRSMERSFNRVMKKNSSFCMYFSVDNNLYPPPQKKKKFLANFRITPYINYAYSSLFI